MTYQTLSSVNNWAHTFPSKFFSRGNQNAFVHIRVNLHEVGHRYGLYTSEKRCLQDVYRQLLILGKSVAAKAPWTAVIFQTRQSVYDTWTGILQLLTKQRSGASGSAQCMMGLIQNSREKRRLSVSQMNCPPKHHMISTTCTPLGYHLCFK